MGALHKIISTNDFNSNGYLGSADEPASLILDERGMICDCSMAGEILFGYRRSDLVWQHVSKLFPQLSEIALVQNDQFNSRLGFLCRCGQLFQVQSRQGDIFHSALHFVHLDWRGKSIIRLILRSSDKPASSSL